MNQITKPDIKSHCETFTPKALQRSVRVQVGFPGALQGALRNDEERTLVKDFMDAQAVVGGKFGFPSNGLPESQRIALQHLQHSGWVVEGPSLDDMGNEQYQLSLKALGHLTAPWSPEWLQIGFKPKACKL